MSDIYVVTCRTGPKEISAIAVPLNTPGMSFGAMEKKMGWKSQPTRVVRFDGVRVPKDHVYVSSRACLQKIFFNFFFCLNRMSKRGDGFKIAMSGLDGGRLLIGACSLGASDACLEILLNWLKVRWLIYEF
jgi:alkylation response protein AidB-like acyl-CoA dehydrogenase